METLRAYLEKVSTYLRDKVGVAAQHGDLKQLNHIWDKMKNQLVCVTSQVKEKGSDALGTILTILQEPDFLDFFQKPDLLKWTESLTKGAATVYDKAMDAEYLLTHIGGGEHRLFDGGHTIMGSWQAARDALKDDTKAQEIIGWAEAYVKDLTITMGMPFLLVDKADFDRWHAPQRSMYVTRVLWRAAWEASLP
jgi:hypothetical protein